MFPGGVPTSPPTSNALSAKVELRCSIQDVKNTDLISKSDPFLVFFVKNPHGAFFELMRTETVENALTTSFKTPLVLEYHFEEVQTIRIEVYDRDSSSEGLKDHDFLGMVEFHLGAIMGTTGQTATMKLLDRRGTNSSKVRGKITIHGEELSACADLVDIQFAAYKIERKNGLFGKSDAFLNIYRSREDGAWVPVWSTEVIPDSLNPWWKEHRVAVQLLCNGDYNRPLRIECMDWEKNGQHKLIGQVDTNLQELVEKKNGLKLINEERKKKKGAKYDNSGTLNVKKCEIIKRHTFLQYLKGGCELSLIVGIDYTASNGAVSVPGSLHFQNPQAFNQYQSAIWATGSILQDYDHDKMFPVFGFGGQINGQVNHCFPLTFDPLHPEVMGIQGILQAYQNSFSFVSLSGPTLFAPLITCASSMASQFVSQEHQKYFVLLILTDGVIMDMDQTIDAIVKASHLPLSIIIVGVGNADFTFMEVLDGDDHKLTARDGTQALRDIVQFVPFNKLQHNSERLTKETLAEVPEQVVQFMKSRNIHPNEPLQVLIPTLPASSQEKTFHSPGEEVPFAVYIGENKGTPLPLAGSAPSMGIAPPTPLMGMAPPAPSMRMAAPAPLMGSAPPAPLMGMAPPAPSMRMAPPAPSMGMAPPAPSMGMAPPAPSMRTTPPAPSAYASQV